MCITPKINLLGELLENRFKLLRYQIDITYSSMTKEVLYFTIKMIIIELKKDLPR